MSLQSACEGYILPWLFSVSPSLFPGHREISSNVPLCSSIVMLSHERPRNNAASRPWTVASDIMSPNKSVFLLNCFSQVFVTATKK
jgi:hypothetical protein